MKQLDTKDRKILFALDQNARQTNAQIAKQVGLSKDSVGYRIKQLEGRGFLSGYRTLIDLRRIGYMQFRVVLKLINTNTTEISKLQSFIKKTKQITSAGVIEGIWDFSFIFCCKNSLTFQNFLHTLFKQFRPFIKEKLITELLYYEELPRSYLVHNSKASPARLPSTTIESIDSFDCRLLELLSNNARISLIELADKLEKSSMAILKRIRNLEKRNIITGYKADIHVMSLNRDYYGVKMNLSNYDEYKKILSYVRSLPEASSILHMLGGYDIEFDLDLANTKEYHRIINEMKDQFTSISEVGSMRTISFWHRELKLL